MVNHHEKPPILRTCLTFPSIQQANPRVWRRFLGYQYYWLCTRFPSTSETEIDHFSVSGHSLSPDESKEHAPHVGLLLLDYLKHQKHEGWTKRNNIFLSFIQKKQGPLRKFIIPFPLLPNQSPLHKELVSIQQKMTRPVTEVFLHPMKLIGFLT